MAAIVARSSDAGGGGGALWPSSGRSVEARCARIVGGSKSRRARRARYASKKCRDSASLWHARVGVGGGRGAKGEGSYEGGMTLWKNLVAQCRFPRPREHRQNAAAVNFSGLLTGWPRLWRMGHLGVQGRDHSGEVADNFSASGNAGSSREGLQALYSDARGAVGARMLGRPRCVPQLGAHWGPPCLGCSSVRHEPMGWAASGEADR